MHDLERLVKAASLFAELRTALAADPGLELNEDEVEKLQRDLYYIGHQSTYLDLSIILHTVAIATRGRRPVSLVTLSACRTAHMTALSNLSRRQTSAACLLWQTPSINSWGDAEGPLD